MLMWWKSQTDIIAAEQASLKRASAAAILIAAAVSEPEASEGSRAVARTLIGGGGVYSYIQVLFN